MTPESPPRSRPPLTCLAAVITAATAVLAMGGAPAHAATTLDLRVDANRDGQLTAADDAGEDRATVAAGALMLANVDDDGRRCDKDLDRLLHRERLTLLELDRCNDGANDVVDGPQDERDLARVAVAPADVAGASLDVEGAPAGRVRVFVRRGGTFTALSGDLTADELRGGAELAVEATDIVRDAAQWDGGVRLTLRSLGAEPDSVALRVAPLIALDATRKAERLVSDRAPTRAAIAADAKASRAQQLASYSRLKADAKHGRMPEKLRRALKTRETWRRHVERGVRSTQRFAEGQRAFLLRLRGGALGVPVKQPRWGRAWVQDAFEPMYQALPTADGSQTMRVALEAGGIVERGQLSPRNSAVVLQAAILRNLRGPDSAAVEHVPEQLNADLWDATGTMEATPPVPGAPLGRLIVGARSHAGPRPATTAVIAAQEAQPLLTLYTGWLDIGHSDEFLAFVPASTPRGWAVVVADPQGALDLLRDLPRDTPVLRGRKGIDGERAQLTAGQALTGDVGGATSFAAKHVAEQLAVLREQLSLTDTDIIHVPVLFTRRHGFQVVVALTGNSVNGVAPGGRTFLAPDPHGPVVGGKDLFREATRKAFAKAGVDVRWVETWPLPHLGSGELHCMTNALRDLRDGRWWTAPGLDAAGRAG